ncbi:MAG: hypothetical protein F9K18_13480, partial [Thermoanaerobaculia bacterium]
MLDRARFTTSRRPPAYLALAGLFLVATAPAVAGDAPASARSLALADLARQAPAAGLVAGDLAGVVVTDEVRTGHNGVTHVYFRQRVHGLEIDGAEMGIHVDRAGRVFHRTGSFVADAAARAAEVPGFPLLGPDEAVVAAAGHLGLAPVAGLALVASPGGAERAAVFANDAVSEDTIPVRLRYLRLPDSDRLRLAWNLVIDDPRSADWWDLWVDAESGALVRRVNWTAHATYRVFASPKESPDDGD